MHSLTFYESGDMMETTLPNFLKQRAYLTPDRPALMFQDEIITFAQLYAKAIAVSEQLASLNITEEDTVAILLKNRPQTVVVLHALQQLRVRTVFLNHRLTPVEMAYQLQDSQSVLLISEDEFSQATEQIHDLDKHISIFTIKELSSLPHHSLEILDEFSLDDVCSIMYTSGTTGKPKGVLQTYGNHWWSAIGSSLNLGIREDDVWLCAVPLFHISGLSILMRSIFYGMPVYLMEKFQEDVAVKLLQSGKITIMSVVTATMQRILHKLQDEKLHPNVRCMLLGGGPAPRPLLEACVEKGIPVFQSYGMTETSSQTVTLAPEDSLTKIGSAGKPLFPAQIRIIHNGKQCKPMEHGEIIVKGPNITIGYLNREDANKESFQDGWFRTGDIGYVDEQGYLYVMDRRSDLIISGGENIYPAEIEEVLISHPDIWEAGVVGMDDETWGKVPVAFIVSNKQIPAHELQQYCEGKLAKYKIPKKVYFVSSLPRNASNKLLRRKLLDLIQS